MDTRRGFFSRLLGIGAAAAVAPLVKASERPTETAGLLTGPPSDMTLYDEARPLYVINVTSEYTDDFAIVTPSGERISLGSAPSRDVYGVGQGEEALRNVGVLLRNTLPQPRKWFKLDP